jgi:RNA polymerase sigma-70 factor (ECF subfamily)
MFPMDPAVEASLVAGLCAGDTAAFDAIYDAMHPRLLAFLVRMARNRAVAEDLLEETWLRFVSSAATLHPETRFVPWLFTVARNLYLSHCRSRLREHAYTSGISFLWPENPPRSPLDLALVSEFNQRLDAAIAELPPLYREAVLLVGADELRPIDAAAVCGVTPEAFRQRLSRARALLSRRLERSASSQASEVSR